MASPDVSGTGGGPATRMTMPWWSESTSSTSQSWSPAQSSMIVRTSASSLVSRPILIVESVNGMPMTTNRAATTSTALRRLTARFSLFAGGSTIRWTP